MSSHYKQIDGKKYSAALLEAADEMVAGKGDGRISVDDAEKLLGLLKRDGKYSDLEKETLSYIRQNYNWTEQANDFLRTQIRSWAAIRSYRRKKVSPPAENPTGIQALSDEELVHAELQLDREMIALRFAKQLETLKETHRFKEIRREIARLRTEQIARENRKGIAKNTLRDLHRGTFVPKVIESVGADTSFASELNEQMEEE